MSRRRKPSSCPTGWIAPRWRRASGGAAFFPGMEAGGLAAARPIIVAANFAAPFRLNHGVVAPGANSNEHSALRTRRHSDWPGLSRNFRSQMIPF